MPVSTVIGQDYNLDALGNSVPVSVTGTTMLTTTLLGANETISSGWLERGQYAGALTSIFSDVPGSYTIEYSDDKQILSLPTITIAYTFVEVMRKGAFDMNTSYIRFTYKNGGVAQTQFRFEARFLSTPVQISSETLNAMGADTRLAMWTKSRLETKDDSGAYDYISRVGRALKVYVDNQNTVDISTLAKETTLNALLTRFNTAISVNGSVSISNLPATQPVSLATNTPDVTDRPGRLLGHVTIDNTFIPVTGGLTDVQLRASAISVNLPTGASTSALQTTGNTTLSNIETKLNSLATEASINKIVQRSATSTLANFTTTATTSVILASNANRKGATIYCTTGTILISLGTTNTLTLFTVKLKPDSYYEVPFGYTGVISGISAGTGTVVEFLA